MGASIRLQLFVAGNSPASQRARANLEAWCRACGQRLELEVVDVFEVPERALAEGVILTPQLILQGPAGRVAIVGDLADASLLSGALLPQPRSA